MKSAPPDLLQLGINLFALNLMAHGDYKPDRNPKPHSDDAQEKVQNVVCFMVAALCD